MRAFFALCAIVCLGGMARSAEPDAVLRFLEEKVKRDADDIVAQNQLAERYLEKMRSTGRLEWLPRARTAADASLRSVPAALNPGGLIISARVALAEHRFAEAAKLARQYCDARPKAPGGWEALFDAKLELGEYEEAKEALAQLEALAGSDEVSVGARQALWARIHGGDAAAPLGRALHAARKQHAKQPQPALLAWCLVQRGELAFVTGDFSAAERYYAEAAQLAPADWRVQSHIAELRGAEGKFDEALGILAKVIEATDRPELMQAAGDMELFRRRPEAAKPWHDRALAEYQASMRRGEKLFLHHLAGFHGDARPDPGAAVAAARQDFAERKSIHARAALAWALHLDGKLAEAAAEMKQALAPGSKDAHLLYQAGLIFTAAGDLKAGNVALRAAAAANPRHMSFHMHH